MISRRQSLRQIGTWAAGAGAALCNVAAYSAVYMDTAAAQKLLLPLATQFTPLPLDVAQMKTLAESLPGPLPKSFAPQVFVATDAKARLGWVMTDSAVGKYELIDFAAGFAADGQCTGVEVMVYRESHGAEIRNAAWRRQFASKKGPAQMRSGDDIRNISGATLSCQHVTEAVQRLAALALQLASAKP